MIYTRNIRDIIDKTEFIPRKLSQSETLKVYHRYYIPEDNLFFKVLDQVTIDNFLYYEIRDNQDHYSFICSPFEETVIYEMYVTDKYNIREIDNIINNKEYYMGYEIQYWFYYKQIDLDSDRYRKFNSFIDLNSLNTINPNKSYMIFAKEDIDNIYYDIKFVSKRRESK